MEFEFLKLDVQEKIATLEVNRPKALNALNEGVLKELEKCYEHLEKNTSVRVVILTGNGEKAFVAGADIALMKDYNSSQGHEFGKLGQTAFDKIEKSSIVTIAAINGFALGGGLELALSCDIRIGSTAAQVGLPEVTLGIIPGFGGTQRLARLIGPGLAKELVFTGDRIKSDEALRIGILNKVYEPADLLAEAKKLADKIVARGPAAIRAAKKVINEGLNTDQDKGMLLERDAFGKLFDTPEPKEGLSAFIEKRQANF